MLSVNNLLKPQDGKPVTVPTQRYDLRCLLLPGEIGEGNYYSSPDEAIMAYYNHDLGLHCKIWVKMEKEIDGEFVTGKIETTVGRIIYNQGIPQNLGFVDRTKKENLLKLEIDFPVSKKTLGKIIAKSINANGLSATAELLDYIKATGFKHSTTAGITVSIDDVKVLKLQKCQKSIQMNKYQMKQQKQRIINK